MSAFSGADESGPGEGGLPTLGLHVAETGHRVLVSLTGDLDAETSARFLAALSVVPTQRRTVEIDLGGVTFLDVAGARALITVRDRVLASGGSLRVLGLDDQRLPAARVLDLRRHLEDRPGGPGSGWSGPG